MRKEKLTFGLIVGTRGVFSAELAKSGRKQLLSQIKDLGHRAIILPQDATPSGAVETIADARKCADLFSEHRNEIDGVIVVLPNFGDELGVINTLQFAKLGVPVLVQASDDELDKLDTLHRRDSFCGKLSVCNNLYQYGIPFTDTGTHTVAIDSPAFARDVEFFAGVCRVVGGLRSARIGAIGTRPAAFQTMRASEKLLQAAGITVVPVDLSEIIAGAEKVDTKSSRARRTLERIKAYGNVPAGIQDLEVKFERNLRLFLAVQDWMEANAIDAAGFQCWTSLQQNYGCAACLTMSMMSDDLRPCACEVDIAGVTAMYALVLASGNAAAIVDWNNNYGDDRNKCVAQHCSNYPKSFLGTRCRGLHARRARTGTGRRTMFRGGQGQGRPRSDDLPSFQHGRPQRPDARIHRRRRIHGRSFQHVGRHCRLRNSQPPGVAQVHLQEGFRASLRDG